MGQINCQQCQMPHLSQPNPNETTLHKNKKSQNQAVQYKRNQQSNNINRINVMSKNRNGFEAFHKKYSTQSTKQDEQNSLSNSSSLKQKCYVVLDNNAYSLQFELQKDKKVFVGSSKNCHVCIKDALSSQNKFKIQVHYELHSLRFKDMGIGEGSFLKCSTLKLPKQIQRNTNRIQEVFVFDDKFLRLTVSYSQKSEKSFHFKLQDLQSSKQQFFVLKTADFLTNSHFQTVFSNQIAEMISFESRFNQNLQLELTFNHKNCWKYLKNQTEIYQGDCIKIGSQIFKVSKIQFQKQLGDSSKFKIKKTQ